MRILIAEDEAISRRILESQLKQWGYEVISVRNGQEAWEILSAQDSPRLAVLDWEMPQMEGVEVCRRLRDRGQEPCIYVLLLTSRAEKESLVAAMSAGADDYVTKPFDAHELEVRLRAGRRIVELQEELISAREALRHQATHDGLTTVWNRTAILETLHREIARSRRERKPLGVIMVDVDHFKGINDAHGHAAGDAVLRELARRMRAVIRPYDSIGRYGGEEFLIVMAGCDERATAGVAERLRACLDGQALLVPEGAFPVTISLGVAASEDPQEDDGERLIRAADGALYEAKAKGRNRVAVAKGV